MRREDAIRQLREIKSRVGARVGDPEYSPDYDEELAHFQADGVLREFLIALGHADVVREFDAIPKWYA